MQYKTDEEIKGYFKLLRNGNLEYREKIIINYMDLVPYIVIRKLNLEYDDDYIEEGYIGLIKAVDTFDCEKNIKFISYASICIQNQIKMFLRKINRHKNICSLDETIIEYDNGETITIEDTLYDEDYDILNEYLLLETNNETKKTIEQIFTMLNSKELKVIKLYYGFCGNPKSQTEIALILGMSQSYVSRLIKDIEEKIRLVYQIKSLTKHK